MSRLYDAIRKKGFVIIVSPPQNSPELVATAFECGADAAKVHINVEHKASGVSFGSWQAEEEAIKSCLRANDHPGPVGIMPGAEVTPNREEMEAICDAGVDFFDIYDHHCPAWMLALPMCAMMAVGPDYCLDHVRALSRLGMDILEASIVPTADYGKPLTVQDLERYWLLNQATDRPVIVPSQKKLTPEDLPLIRETGVRGVMLGTISLGSTVESFKEKLPDFIAKAK